MNLNFVIKKPILTEKSLKEAAAGKFTFLVAHNATKLQVKQAVIETYGVDVVSVATTQIPVKSYRSGKRRQSKLTEPAKKAILELKKGQKIDLFDIQNEA